ncbi:hypothetical protein DFH08DRAFT_873136 [Mycena albidolilacea]|uniref:MARVEL domain-containing protein n=1 Tax=Mycena albidolilacea TaxID=1033008 RepID=A0AAD6ZYN8_9AGAR|nr:hypothetical protein DFH08DRAFT_873136 [Mycena albidolilacea]
MNFLATFRYIVFAVFIICNAILASVAVWNASLVSPSSRDSHIDTFLVIVGALGLALTFTIIFVELIRRNAFTSRVWFEILWTTVFFGLDLSGAAILSAVGPNDMCAPKISNRGHSHHPSGACSSSRVLMGFTWLCTFVLLTYLILLVVLTIANRNDESMPRIWECTVHNFPPLTVRRSNVPVSPFLPRFTQDKSAAIVSPAPQRPSFSPSALYTLRSAGLDSRYQIEHFRPSSHAAGPVTSPADYLHRNPSNPGNVQAAVALYPQFLSSAYVSQPPPARTQPPPIQTLPSQPMGQSPPPLGDWPRADAPLRIKRKAPPPEEQAAAGSAPSRPMGPRTRAGTTNTRPPPLDLSSISTRQDRERHV